MKEIIIVLSSLLVGIISTFFVSHHFYRKDLKSIRRRLSFPITPAHFLNIGKSVPVPRKLIIKKYDPSEVDYKWIKGIYKKDRKRDWIWKICPRCGSENVKKIFLPEPKLVGEFAPPTEEHVKMGIEDETYYFIKWEDRYVLHCKDCDTLEGNWSAELHAEAIPRFFQFIDLEKVKTGKQKIYLRFKEAMEEVMEEKSRRLESNQVGGIREDFLKEQEEYRLKKLREKHKGE